MRFRSDEIAGVLQYGTFSGTDSDGNILVQTFKSDDSLDEMLTLPGTIRIEPCRPLTLGEVLWVHFLDNKPIQISLGKAER